MSTPMSLAFRSQSPSGSRSRGSEGTTVSQTAVRIGLLRIAQHRAGFLSRTHDTGL